MRLALLVLLGLAVTGCEPRETAYMRNPANGDVAACGPYYRELNIQATAERWCIEDYARRGYTRVPGPNS